MKRDSRRRRRFGPAQLFRVIVLLYLVSPAATGVVEAAYRFEGVERVVVVGDAHGAHANLRALLGETGLVDETGRWAGGQAHLVSLGDFLDRGAESRKIMDLLMSLQEQAAQAGGRVHVLLGNHEMMNLTGDLRDVSLAEYLSYQDLEDPAERDRARESYLSQPAQRRPFSFEDKYPPGYFGHRRALSATGRYGSWLREQPFLIVINQTALVHAGLTGLAASEGLEGLNQRLASMLEHYERGWEALYSVVGAEPHARMDERVSLAENILAGMDPAGLSGAPGAPGDGANPAPALQDEPARQAREFADTVNSELFFPDGPLWTRDAAQCVPVTVEDVLDAAMERLGVSRVVVGHTVTPDRRIVTRLDGRLVMVDTGMLESVYQGGRTSALVLQGDALQARYLGEPGLADIHPLPRRVGPRPGGMSDDELEQFLRTAEVTHIEPIPEGITKPRRVTLEKDGITLHAVFKYVDLREERLGGIVTAIGDRWGYELAAYRLDRLLGLDLVPVTVERALEGRPGSLQFYVEGMVNWIQVLADNLSTDEGCPMRRQYELLKVFDALIFNQDRSQQNLTFQRDIWRLTLIDHSRAFEAERRLPKTILKYQDFLVVRPALARRLETLTRADLDETMTPYLSSPQISAILKRRDRLLKNYRATGEEVVPARNPQSASAP